MTPRLTRAERLRRRASSSSHLNAAPSMPDLDNTALRHLAEAREQAEESARLVRKKCIVACLVGLGLAGLFMLLAWPAA